MQFVQNGHMNMRGRGDGMNGENGIDIYILLCVKQMASGKFREDNGTPLQYSCLENPMDGRGW